MQKLTITGVLASTRPMDAYGGIALSEDLIRSLARDVERAPLGIQHDPRLRLDAKLVSSRFERDAEGHLQLWVSYEVDEDAWRNAGGDSTRGFSFTGRVPALGASEGAAASIAADAHWFSEKQLEQAFESLQPNFHTVSGLWLYQFAAEPEALVALNFVVPQLVAIGSSIAASGIYDVLKNLLTRTRASVFSIEVSDEKTGKTARAYIRTNSPQVLKDAIDTLPDALAGGGSHEYSEDDGGWREGGGGHDPSGSGVADAD